MRVPPSSSPADDDGQHGVDVVDEHMLGLLSTFIFVFAYLCTYFLCILHLIHGNVIIDILESHAFQKI